jgi:gas vesicle protein
MNKGTRNALLGFVAGVAAGALTGILIAPDKGSKTRKDITETLSEKVDDLKEQVNEVVTEMRGKAKEAEEKVKEKVNEKTASAKS